MAHMAMAARVPEMAMNEDEAKQLATAICNYARHTRFKAAQKTMDLMALLTALAMVEGTRILAIARNRSNVKRAREIERQAKAGSPNVVHMAPGSLPGT